MTDEYDRKIKEHYKNVAQEDQLSSSSTMSDAITREIETVAIIEFVRDFLRYQETNESSLVLADVGCGNGYTLSVLHQNFPSLKKIGLEFTEELLGLAQSRFKKEKKVVIEAGDIRKKDMLAKEKYDILICQRVIINLLDTEDQRRALDNIVNCVKPTGVLFFIEAFQKPLSNLNEAREEFDLPPILQAHHNLYLKDDFFNHRDLEKYRTPTWYYSQCHLSTHYFVSRVLHAILIDKKKFLRNSHFVKFFAEALPAAIGDYSQLRFMTYKKKIDTARS